MGRCLARADPEAERPPSDQPTTASVASQYAQQCLDRGRAAARVAAAAEHLERAERVATSCERCDVVGGEVVPGAARGAPGVGGDGLAGGLLVDVAVAALGGGAAREAAPRPWRPPEPGHLPAARMDASREGGRAGAPHALRASTALDTYISTAAKEAEDGL